MSEVMTTSEQGKVALIVKEAIVRSPYYDSVNVLTFGIGHTAAAGKPDPKSLKKSKRYQYRFVLDIFNHDLKKFEERVNDAVKVPLKQHEFDALVSFDYNTGGIYRAKLTKLLNEGKKKRAAAAFMGWLRPKSIIGRRTKEMNLFLTGKYPKSTYVTEYQTNGKGRILWKSAERIDISEYI